MRKPKQTHTKTNTKHNHQPAATRKNRAPKVYVSPALSTRSRRRSPVIEQRRAYGGGRKMRGYARSSKPPSCSHRCKEGQPASCKSKIDSRITDRHGEVPGAQWRKGKVQNGPISQRKSKASTRPMVVSQWGLVGKNNARPAQGTPWWSASGAAPSNSRHDLWLYYWSPAKVIVHN